MREPSGCQPLIRLYCLWLGLRSRAVSLGGVLHATPAGIYQTSGTNQSWEVPWVAHFADLGHLGEFGTSFANPRACAKAANIIRDAYRRAKCG
jgi:hypothetical protein